MVSHKTTTMMKDNQLRAIGFCGADDSVDPNFLAMICNSYPVVEFGVLFRPDKEGQPRYATMEWVERLASVACRLNFSMKLAAHLCGSRVNDLLNGNGDEFLDQLVQWKFGRVQINATAINGVDTSKLHDSVQILVRIVEKYTALEFIVQKNEETKPLWEGLILHYSNLVWPSNISMLFDESKGTGVASNKWPTVDSNTSYGIGYAGGIGPHNIYQILPEVSQAANGRTIWIDMESSLRSIKNDKDVFDLGKCFQVIHAAMEMGYIVRPPYVC